MNQLIKSGIYPPGGRVPGTRDMAGYLKVHRNTVAAAYDKLIDTGVLVTIGRKGTFVAESTGTLCLADTGAGAPHYNFSFKDFYTPPAIVPSSPMDIRIDDGYPDFQKGPFKELNAAYRRAYQNMRRRGDIIHGDDLLHIVLELQKTLGAQRSIHFTPENIMFVRGCQMALYLIAQCLTSPGDQIALENPANQFFRLSLEKSGAELVPIPVQQDGPDLDALERAAQGGRLKALVLYPQAQWPTTIATSASKRSAIDTLARRYRFAVVETDMDAEFAYDGDMLPRMASAGVGGNVIYLSCVSAMLPQLSFVNYVIGPPDFIRSLKSLWLSIDKQRDMVMERAILELLRLGILNRYQRKSVSAYRNRRDQVSSLADHYLGRYVNFNIPRSGLALWLEPRGGTCVPELVNRLHQYGVSVVSPEQYYFDGGVPKGLRVGFASAPLNSLESCFQNMATVFRSMKSVST